MESLSMTPVPGTMILDAKICPMVVVILHTTPFSSAAEMCDVPLSTAALSCVLSISPSKHVYLTRGRTRARASPPRLSAPAPSRLSQ